MWFFCGTDTNHGLVGFHYVVLKDKSTVDETESTLLTTESSVITRFTRRTGINLNNVILMCWSEAQTNPQVKSLIGTF